MISWMLIIVMLGQAPEIHYFQTEGECEEARVFVMSNATDATLTSCTPTKPQ